MMNLNRSHAIAPMQNDDMKMGKSWAAFTNLQRYSVLIPPSGQCPSSVYHSVSGEVNVQRKKSDRARATMKEFLYREKKSKSVFLGAYEESFRALTLEQGRTAVLHPLKYIDHNNK